MLAISNYYAAAFHMDNWASGMRDPLYVPPFAGQVCESITVVLVEPRFGGKRREIATVFLRFDSKWYRFSLDCGIYFAPDTMGGPDDFVRKIGTGPDGLPASLREIAKDLGVIGRRLLRWDNWYGDDAIACYLTFEGGVLIRFRNEGDRSFYERL